MPFRDEESAGLRPRLARAASRRFRACLPPLNFITVHYAYFVVVPLVASVVFWGSSEPAFSISYTDSLFLVVSAMTEAGLNTVNLSQMTTWQQILLFLLIIFGSSIWVSIWTVAFRKHVFEQRFNTIIEAERVRRLRRLSATAHTNLAAPVFWRRLLGCCSLPAFRTPAAGVTTNRSEENTNRSSPVAGQNVPRQPDTGGITRSSPPPTGHITFADALHIDAMSSAYEQTEKMPVRRAPAVPSTAATMQNDKADDGKHLDNDTAGSAALLLTRRTVGRNAQFHGLTREEREQLGGCEYRALKLLSVVVPLYFLLWQLLGCIALGAWIHNHMGSVATANGINPWWLGIFNGASAFNNSGMSLLDANMIPFENAHFMIITMGLMILAGNTAYPVLLRLIFWSSLKVINGFTNDAYFADTKATLVFILKYPRRVYTNLFPPRPTWWLLFMIVLLNCIDWVSFELLNLGNPVIETIPTGSRILDGLFQAIAVRSGGFYIVPMSEVYIGLQLLYVIMMYISVYPVVITMRHSNVYEERSLGIYVDDADTAADLEDSAGAASATNVQVTSPPPIHEPGRTVRRTFTSWYGIGVASPFPRGDGGSESRINFISQQIHGQLAHDIWWLVLAVLVITTIETSHFLADPVSYSVFNVIFEVVSAYGCVGISMGLPSAAYSFSGGWHNASKVVLCLVMIRGRHRGLPVALDRAVRLPGEQLHRDEEEDYRIRRSVASRRLSVDGGPLQQ
ncbi:Cation transporter [Niveomyces insectorum RCEF 264]|uniref:Potassium transport protein n=1 Tax=Niveomyces insectorum RCEF 264 TaxID=1081102 RepID=A0A167VDD2_9HYPO|nr:Cation transporter [Niveomyces insectorum RCEF 264]